MSTSRKHLLGAGLGALLLTGFVQAQATPFGTGCAGASGLVPVIDAPTNPWTHEEYYVDVSGPPLTPGVLLAGVSNSTWGAIPLPLDLTFVGLSGCDLLVSPDLMLAFTTDTNGEFRIAATGPPLGMTAYAQAYLQDVDFPAGVIGGMTAAIEISGAGALQAGDVVITEIMVNPQFTSDSAGEWFEVTNLTGFPVNLEGWRIDSGLAVAGPLESHIIDSQGAGVILPPGGFTVLSLGPDSTNGGIGTDYVYGSAIGFENDGIDNIRLISKSIVIVDFVQWDDGVTFPDPTGKSMSLNFFHYHYLANDMGQFWCEGKFPIGGSQNNTDLATPGATNPLCN